jgi:hypothetical protein
MIVNYASVWNVNYDHNRSFKVLTTVIAIVNYERKTFMVHATVCKLQRKSFITVTPDGTRHLLQDEGDHWIPQRRQHHGTR